MIHGRIAKIIAAAGVTLAVCGGAAACGTGQNGTSTTSGGTSWTAPTDNSTINPSGGGAGYGDGSGYSNGSDGNGYGDGTNYNSGYASPPAIEDPISNPQLGQSGSDWNAGN